MANLLRVAVCQLECHPTVVVADRDLLQEPFPPRRGKPSLSDLARFRLDVSMLQEECARTYGEWHRRRLNAVLAWLSQLDPFPDVIVFPECSVALPDLHELRAHAVTHDIAIFAGTHTVRLGKEELGHYAALNAKVAGHKQSLKAIQGLHVMPILTNDKTILHVKRAPSVFEQTDTSSDINSLNKVEPISLHIRGRDVRLLPLVCSEALNIVSPVDNYDAAVIVARHDNPSGFDALINANVNTKRPVILCNDGAFGESAVHTVVDSRMSGVWWWNPPISGRLPPGDSILVADINLDAASVQQAVANPSRPATLVALAPIVADGDKHGLYATAQELANIADKDDNSLQHQLLEGAQQQWNPQGISQLIIPHVKQLAKLGILDSTISQCLLRSCVIPGVIPLSDIEAVLAQRCIDSVTQLSDSTDTDDTEALACVARFRRECKLRFDSGSSAHLTQGTQVSNDAALDREEESRSIRHFLEQSRQLILCLTGLDDVGKETLVSTTLGQLGHKNVCWITLSSDSTLSYIGAVFARTLRFPEESAVDAKEFLTIKNLELLDRIPLGTIVVITECDQLRDHGNWRESDAPHVLEGLARVLGSRKGKLILCSTARVDLPRIEAAAIRRLYLEGLPPEFARLLLDQQLRRVGIDPQNYIQSQRDEIVELLGGHPGAITLCADYIQQRGLGDVLADLQKRRGIHTDIVRRILKGMEFTHTESTVLALLSETRSLIPVQVLSKAIRKNVSVEVNSLVAKGIIERGWRDLLKLPDLVKGFADLTESDNVTVTLFHKSAAEELAELSREVKNVPQLNFAIASQYHANLAGDPNLAAELKYLIDGSLGSVRQLVERHDYERAKPIIDRLLGARRSPEVFQLAALVNARLGLVEEALTLAKEAYSADNAREWIVTEVGRLALHVHRTDVASECVRLVKNTGHDSPYLATLEGKIALKDGREDLAIDAFRRAVQLSESNDRWQDAWPHFYLGRALVKRGESAEAIDVLYVGETITAQRRRRNRRLLIAIRTELAVAYIFSKDFEGATRIFDLLGSEEAGNAEVVWAYALFLAATGDVNSVSHLAKDTLSKLNPASARDRYGRCQVHLYRALVFLAIGNKSQASEEFAKASKEDERNVFVLLRWSQTLIELANQSQEEGDEHASRMCAEHAKELADNALRFHPGNGEALRILEKLSDDFNVL